MPPRAAEKARGSVLSRQGHCREAAKELILLVGSRHRGELNRGLQNLEAPFGKVLILFVRFCSLGALNRGLQDLDVLCKEKRFYSFRLYEKNQKYPKGLRPSGLRGAIQSSVGNTFREVSGGTCRNRLFARNGGEKALNRCEVRALQREDLERRLKEQPYFLRTVGYGWVRICGVSCRKGLLLRAIRKGLCG